MVPKLNPDMSVGHESFQFPVDLSLAHRMADYIPGSFKHANWTQFYTGSGLELHPSWV